MRIVLGFALTIAAIALMQGSAFAVGAYQGGFAAYQSGNYAHAYELWLPLAKTGDSDAEFGLGVLLSNGQGVPKNEAQAAKWYWAAAEKGNPDAQFNLALLYDSGQGVPPDKAQALKWYQAAAIKGHVGAQYNLALMYENGDGIPADPSLAAYWYRKAAEQGHTNAQNNLGVLYDKGIGVPVNKVKAAKWYRKAAEQGFARAQFNLGVMYDFGTGVPLDDIEAMKWYRKAAEQGDVEAEYNLALMFDQGEGAPVNKSKAMKWYQKAAEQGSPAAQNNLGVLFESGNGVPHNAAAAAYWYRRAADDGNVSAQKNLAALYTNGSGLPQDLVEAYKWYTIAIDALPKGADREVAIEERSNLANEMNRTSIREAKRRVHLWRQNNRVELTAAAATPPRLPDQTQPLRIYSTGSGFFVTMSGLIVTNNHVVAGCSDLRLKLGRERIGTASLVTASPTLDLALLRSTTTPPAAAVFRMGKDLRAGDDIIAIGYPLRGLLASEANITTGDISATAGLHDNPDYFQITAPVQPGNSGGPLLDRSSHVVGVVSAKLDALDIAQSYGDLPQNVNFAIKGNVVVNFLNKAQITPLGGKTGPRLSAADVGEAAQRYTVLIECWK